MNVTVERLAHCPYFMVDYELDGVWQSDYITYQEFKTYQSEHNLGLHDTEAVLRSMLMARRDSVLRAFADAPDTNQQWVFEL